MLTGAWLGPPRPPSPSMTVNDTSCQGVLGVTLRNALMELKNGEFEERAKACEGKKCQAVHSDDEDGNTVSHGDESDVNSLTMELNDEVISDAMMAFGQVIAQSNAEQHQALTSFDTAPQNTIPPPVLLRGKVKSYNRAGSKWKILLKDTKIRLRKPLPRHRSKQRRHLKTLWWHSENNPSVSVADTEKDEIFFPELEILAYNDSVG